MRRTVRRRLEPFGLIEHRLVEPLDIHIQEAQGAPNHTVAPRNKRLMLWKAMNRPIAVRRSWCLLYRTLEKPQTAIEIFKKHKSQKQTLRGQICFKHIFGEGNCFRNIHGSLHAHRYLSSIHRECIEAKFASHIRQAMRPRAKLKKVKALWLRYFRSKTLEGERCWSTHWVKNVKRQTPTL